MRELFWLSLAALFYTYVGYPLLVWVLARLFGSEPNRREIFPSVSLLIPCYEEERHIEEKLRNSLDLDYPKGRLEIVVASDGSTDRTDEIVRRFHSQGVKLLSLRSHLGKSAMLSRVVPRLQGRIIVFSDASSRLKSDALRLLVRSFADSKVGCVSGGYHLISSSDLRSQGEGLYWRYETWIKRMESMLHSILGAHGALYAVRKGLFRPLADGSINDDYLIPMRVVTLGHRAVYDPEAVAWEQESTSVRGEFARRRRIAAGNCQQIGQLKELFNSRNGGLAFSFLSHKVLRTCAPFLMLALLASSFWLSWPCSGIALALQLLFYLTAFLGFLAQRWGWRWRLLSPCFYFCLGNLAMLAGVLRYLAFGPPAWGLSKSFDAASA